MFENISNSQKEKPDFAFFVEDVCSENKKQNLQMLKRNRMVSLTLTVNFSTQKTIKRIARKPSVTITITHHLAIRINLIIIISITRSTTIVTQIMYQVNYLKTIVSIICLHLQLYKK